MINPVLKKIVALTAFAAAILISGCKQKATTPPANTGKPDSAALRTEIETRLREYERLLQNRDSLALGDMYMEDAEIIPSITGRVKITEALGAMIRDSITGRFTTTQIWGNHELIVEEGKGNWLKPGGVIAGRGKYLLVWKKDNGKWKILRDTWFPEK